MRIELINRYCKRFFGAITLINITLSLNGCLSGTASNDEETQRLVNLKGLYEGIPTYQGTGYANSGLIQYYRFHKDGTFYWIGLQSLKSFRAHLKDSVDTSIAYFMYSDLKGNYSLSGDSLSFYNMLARDADVYASYNITGWDSITSHSYNISKAFPIFNDTIFATGIQGGGSNSDGEYTYYMTYKRIGDENASIPIKYLGP